MLFLWVASTALAVDIAVHPDDEASEDAAAVVAGAAGLPPDSVAAIPVTQLVSGRSPVLVGNGRLEVCTSPPAQARSIEESVQAARGAMAYMDYEAAITDLERAEARLGCAVDPIEARTAAQLQYLIGMVALYSRDDDMAAAMFSNAVAIDPEFPWDDTFAPDGQPLLEQARSTTATADKVELMVHPVMPAGQLRIDGELLPDPAARAHLSPGLHILQLGTEPLTTLRVSASAGETITVVAPGMLAADALPWVHDEIRGPSLSAVLQASVAADAPPWVVLGNEAWRAGADGTWAMTSRLVPVDEPRPASTPNYTPITIAGATTAVAGTVWAAIAYGTAKGIAKQYPDALDSAQATNLETRYDRQASQLLFAEILTGAGLATTGVGIVLTVKPGT